MVSRAEAARLDKTRDARATHRVVRVVNAQPTANMKSTAPPLYTPRHPTWGTLERVDRIEKRRALIPPRELRGGGGGGGGGRGELRRRSGEYLRGALAAAAAT